MKLFAGQQWRHRHREQIYGHREEEEGESVMYGENREQIYGLREGEEGERV